METEKLVQTIIDKVDPDELIDILSLTTEELVHILHHVIIHNQHRFEFLEEDETEYYEEEP